MVSRHDETFTTSLANLFSDNASLEDNITMCTKVVKIYPSKTVVNQEAKTNTVAEVLILAKTVMMQLDLWNKQITQVQENSAYQFTSLSTSYWNNVKKLTATINTVIRQSLDVGWCSLECAEDIPDIVNEHVIQVSCIHTIEDVQRYKTCCNCNKQVTQMQENVVKCDHCWHMMRASSCPTKLYANVVLLIEDEKNLSRFLKIAWKTVPGQFDHETIDTADVVQKLLFLNNFNITYNERNIVTKLQAE